MRPIWLELDVLLGQGYSIMTHGALEQLDIKNGIQIKRAKEKGLRELESYLQQNANKVDAVAKEKEAGQNQKENRKAQKVSFFVHPGLDNIQRTFGNSLNISSGDNRSE